MQFHCQHIKDISSRVVDCSSMPDSSKRGNVFHPGHQECKVDDPRVRRSCAV